MGCEKTTLPSTDTVFRHAKPSIVTALSIASIALLISAILTHKHVKKLKQCSSTRRRDYYVDIVRVGVVFCVTGALPMIVPRAYELFGVIQAIYEARVLYDFGFLLINYIAGFPLTFVRKCRPVQVFIPVSGENVHDHREAKQKCIEVLGSLPAKRYLAVPPFGLCFRFGPFTQVHPFGRDTIRTVIRCLTQYLYVGPCVSLVALFLELASDRFDGRPDLAVVVFRGIGTLSILTAVWGLFIMYGATNKTLSQYHITFKFAAIKGMLLVTGVQELVISSYVKGSQHNNTDKNFTIEFYARFFSSFAICIEGFVMTVLLLYAFPVAEVFPEYASGRSILDVTADSYQAFGTA